MKTLVGIEVEKMSNHDRKEYLETLFEWLTITKGDRRIYREIQFMLTPRLLPTSNENA